MFCDAFVLTLARGTPNFPVLFIGRTRRSFSKHAAVTIASRNPSVMTHSLTSLTVQPMSFSKRPAPASRIVLQKAGCT